MSDDDNGTGWGPEPAEPVEADYLPVWHNSTTAGHGMWHVPALGDGSGAWFGGEINAENVGRRAYLDARDFHQQWHLANDHRPTAGERAVADEAERKAARLADGYTEDYLARHPELLEPEPEPDGHQLYRDYKNGIIPTKIGPVRD